VLLRVPQAPDAEPPQDRVQLAPAFAESFAISTPKSACCETAIEVIGAGSKEMVIEGCTMVITAELLDEGSLVAAALMVTVFPRGTLGGAV
jgi:hypothetical protein